MGIGERIKNLRTINKMTQKWLGMKLGFSERTAETRIGQYETGVRTPKQEMIDQMAYIFGVSPLAISVPNIEDDLSLMHTLFAIEDIFGLTPTVINNRVCLIVEDGHHYEGTVQRSIEEWNEMAQKYRNGEITKGTYDHWRYSYPDEQMKMEKRRRDEWRAQNKENQK